MAPRKEITIEVIEDRPMTEAELETLVGILFNMWRQRHERERKEGDFS